MILVPLDKNASLGRLSSAATVASSRGNLQNLVLLVREAGWGVIVTKTLAGDHNVIAVAEAARRSALVGDIRRWHREHGYTFALDSFNLEDQGMKIDEIYTLASVFTHWAVRQDGELPSGYVRL